MLAVISLETLSQMILYVPVSPVLSAIIVFLPICVYLVFYQALFFTHFQQQHINFPWSYIFHQLLRVSEQMASILLSECNRFKAALSMMLFSKSDILRSSALQHCTFEHSNIGKAAKIPLNRFLHNSNEYRS